MTTALESAARIGFLGDTHGALGHILLVCRAMQKHGVEVIVQLGDFGMIFPGGNWGNDLDRLSNRLSKLGITLYFVDGNHEAFPLLYSFPIGGDGVRWVRNNIGHLPRGYRARLASGRTLAALGGANSIDLARRAVGVTWWFEESITEADLAALGHEPVDVLVAHDAPEHVPSLDRQLAGTDQFWPAAALEYAAAGRRNFHRGFVQVRPKLVMSGHYHVHIDEIVDYSSEAGAFQSRVVILDRDQMPLAECAAILDVETFELIPLTDPDHGRPS